MTQTRTDAIRLYDYELSGNCYKVRLLLHWLGLTTSANPGGLPPGARAPQSPTFLHDGSTRAGSCRCWQDGELTLPDAQAILVYLASRYDPQGRWYPDDAATRGRITLWLATADDLTRSIAAARQHYSFGMAADIARCEALARASLRLLDDALAENQASGRPWLAGTHEPSIADIACFPYAALAGEARIDLRPYPALQAWIRAMRHRDGFIAMPGILDPAL
jgi:glutathione S-transferase